MRIVDVIQVLMQDTRVACKQAELLAAEEHRKEVAHRVDMRDRTVKKRTVVKTESTEKRQPIKKTKQSKAVLRVADEKRTMHIDISA